MSYAEEKAKIIEEIQRLETRLEELRHAESKEALEVAEPIPLPIYSVTCVEREVLVPRYCPRCKTDVRLGILVSGYSTNNDVWAWTAEFGDERFVPVPSSRDYLEIDLPCSYRCAKCQYMFKPTK